MQIKIPYIKRDFLINDLANENWQKAEKILIQKYWSGENAPVGRYATAKLLWSRTALYIRFKANQIEPLIISKTPNLKTKTIGLWDRDVCEIFVAPNPKKSHNYYEFEIAPNGEWIDLAIHLLPDKRETDFEYDSGMQSSARIDQDKVLLAIKIEWKAFDKVPKAGDIWLGNLSRAVGSGETRGYLTWQPTKTEKPNFHVPEVFGKFVFIK